MSWETIAAGVGTGAAGLGGLISSIGGLVLGDQANKLDLDNLRFQQQAFQRNYQNMVDEQGYRRGLQQTMFDREDSAVQRRVADLKAAGLSPVLAAGSSAQAGPVVSTAAPNMEAAQRGLGGKIAQLNAMNAVANIGQTLAQTALTAQEVENRGVEKKKLESELGISELNRKYLESIGEYRFKMFMEQMSQAASRSQVEATAAEEAWRYGEWMRKNHVSKKEIEAEVERYRRTIIGNQANLSALKEGLGASSEIMKVLMQLIGTVINTRGLLW